MSGKVALQVNALVGMASTIAATAMMWLLLTQPAPDREGIDVDPVTPVRRYASRAGVRMAEVTEFLESGELVADGGR